MRPMVLELQAFMPFATRQVVDFRALGDHRLMMIAGETGAGKTAILDAIAYGLFGASTGGSRGESVYRSDHAVDGHKTYVDFQFEVRGELYRVVRFPPGQTGKKQGLFEFWRLHQIGDPNGRLIATGKTAVNEAVRRLLKYNMDQFRSVIVLPQGQFRAFLAAKTDQKAAILSTLFRTGRYHRLQEALKARFAALAKQQSDTQQQIEGILSRAGVANEVDLLALIAETQGKVSLAKAAVQAAAKVAENALENHKAGQHVSNLFLRYEGIAKSIDALESQATDLASDRAALQAARAARVLVPVEVHLMARQAEQQTARQRVAVSKANFERVQTSTAEAELVCQREEARDPEVEALRRALLQLEGLVSQVRIFAQLRSEAFRLVADVEHAQTHLDELNNTVLALRQASELKSAQLDTARLSAAEIGAHQAEYDKLAQQLDQRLKLSELSQRLEQAVAGVERSENERRAHAEVAQSAKQRFETLYAAHLAAYAAKLAGELEDGHPCRVCGSTVHPHPAHSTTDAPEKADVEAAREAWQKAEEARENAEKYLFEARGVAQPVKAEVSLIREQLGTEVSTPIDDISAKLDKAKSAFENARVSEGLVPELEREIEELQSQGARLEADLKQAQLQLNKLQASSVEKNALMKDKEAVIPEHLRAPDAVEQQIQAHKNTLQSSTHALETARETVTRMKEAEAQAKADMKNAIEAHETAQTKADEAEKTFFGRLAETGFDHVQSYEDARLSDEEIKALEVRIDEYEERLNQLLGQREELNEAIEGLEQPDMSSLASALEQARERETETRGALSELEKVLSPLEQGLEAIKSYKAESERREKDYGVIAKLAQTAQGENHYKLKFERYVLASLLDRVLIHASERLHRMSDGRYTLRRTDLNRHGTTKNKIDRRSQAGLEVEVIDTFTGKERDANTLSGGEGFQASLALALGLADVIQAQSGGIELNAMFIDEGFGTQSAEALESVMDTLVSMQASGRLVGFISHVEGMKERIPAKLLIDKTPTGSHARFSVQ